MRKFLQFICLAGVLFTFAQCATQDLEPMPIPESKPAPEQVPDSEQTPDPDEETWELTFDNCRRVLYGYRYVVGIDYYRYFPEEYKGLTRTVTFRWAGDEFSIKGIFPDYPDAWVKGTVKDDKVYFDSTQLLEGTDGKQMYFHSGSAYNYHQNHDRTISLGMAFEPLRYPEGDCIGYYYEIFINEDRSAITPAHIDDAMSGNAFWLSKDKEPNAEFYTTWHNGKVEGTPFPDTNSCMMNMVFRKVSSSGVGEVRPDPK